MSRGLSPDCCSWIRPRWRRRGCWSWWLRRWRHSRPSARSASGCGTPVHGASCEAFRWPRSKSKRSRYTRTRGSWPKNARWARHVGRDGAALAADLTAGKSAAVPAVGGPARAEVGGPAGPPPACRLDPGCRAAGVGGHPPPAAHPAAGQGGGRGSHTPL